MTGLADIDRGEGVDILSGDGAIESDRMEDVRRRLRAIIEADPRKIYDSGGRVIPPDQWPEREALAIQRWSHNQGTDTWNITFHDKNKASDQLSKIDGLYKADNEQQQESPLAKLMSEVPREKLRMFVAQLVQMRNLKNADPGQD